MCVHSHVHVRAKSGCQVPSYNALCSFVLKRGSLAEQESCSLDYADWPVSSQDLPLCVPQCCSHKNMPLCLAFHVDSRESRRWIWSKHILDIYKIVKDNKIKINWILSLHNEISHSIYQLPSDVAPMLMKNKFTKYTQIMYSKNMLLKIIFKQALGWWMWQANAKS